MTQKGIAMKDQDEFLIQARDVQDFKTEELKLLVFNNPRSGQN